MQAVPGMSAVDVGWLNQLIAAADKTVKSYCKQTLEYQTCTQYLSGNGERDLIIKQLPVWNDSTLAVYLDPTGFAGQTASSFPAGTLLTKGNDYYLVTDSDDGTQSIRGLIRKIAGAAGPGFIGFWPESLGLGKLSAYRLPTWPRGDGNIKVVAHTGFNPVPEDLQNAVMQTVAWMVRTNPQGSGLSNESLGAYSYGVFGRLTSGQIPELAEAAGILRYYREWAF